MVKNTGETLRTDTCRPLNAPGILQVKEDPAGLPLAVRVKRRQAIITIDDRWRLDDEWWRTDPVSRLYFNVRVSSGEKLTIYKDLVAGDWYRQSY